MSNSDRRLDSHSPLRSSAARDGLQAAFLALELLPARYKETIDDHVRLSPCGPFAAAGIEAFARRRQSDSTSHRSPDS